ncbi:MAG TPA: rRNA maturation RNase YbeY [Candidatus Kapabacteria bacterium]|nr:rRNA maturation RNase YbeY [Candidatus Kapabacteria bacterium]
MKHTITIINAHPNTRLRRAPIAAGVAATLRGEKIGRGEVRVILVSDEELLGMNREHLGHDYYTDVITFPLENDPLEGEIYISVDRAREQAAEFGVGLYEEVRRLAIHGTLHLAGHDDATEAERAAMRSLEDRYLSVISSDD